VSTELGDYWSPEELERQTRQLAEAARAETVDYGQSVQGWPLRAVRVPCKRAGTTAKVLCAANIHGQEYIGGRVALGLLAGLADAKPPFRSLLELAEVWVIPCLNPDGYARTFDRAGRGRVVELRTNAHGVDLNRNFPLPQGARQSRFPGAGSARSGAITYRGPSSLSEPETRFLDGLLSEQRFQAVLSLHCFMGTLIPARTTDPREFSVYGRLCREFALAQPRWRYRRLASRRFDVFTGELEDHAHHHYRAWSSCVEVFPLLHSLRQHLLAPSVFWRFNPRNPREYVENDVPGLVAFFLKALECPRPGELGAVTADGASAAR
jgi:hypothetical protein